MSKLIWDKIGERVYETGVKMGVLYPQNGSGIYPLGIAWNGLTAVTESPTGAESSPLYADDIKYVNIRSTEEFGATIEAYTYPEEFADCDGSAELSTGVRIGQQSRKTFGLAYRTAIGNDVENIDYGYKLHLIYGATAAPSEKAYSTINDSPEAITFSWEIETTPVEVTNKKPTASITIDSTKVDSAKLAALELILYGNTGVEPRLPLPDEIASIFATAAPTALAMSTIVPADAATAIAVGANIVITFNNKILEESIIVSSAAGVIIPASKTWDATGKILTIDPTANLTAATTYLVALVGVADIYSQTLTPVIKKFTTA
ncbi:MAG: hypothetical protein K0S61_132 [Anaerocolumna sp.]|jgi:hypothetical protein|nr:hypothetical protein [Anaerocolumna sp.]